MFSGDARQKNQRPTPPLPLLPHPTAFVAAAHGLKGELYVRLYAARGQKNKPLTLQQGLIFTRLAQKTPLRLCLAHVPSHGVQFFLLQHSKLHKQGAIWQLKELTNRTEAEKLKGHAWHAPRQLLLASLNENTGLSLLLNHTLINASTNTPIGTVTGCEYHAGCAWLKVTTGCGNRGLLPARRRHSGTIGPHPFDTANTDPSKPRNILVPFAKELLVQIKDNQVFLKIPQGLL